MRRQPLSIRAILLLTVSALTVMIVLLAAQAVHDNWQRLRRIEGLQQAMLMGDQLFDAVEKLTVERDVAYSMLVAGDMNMVRNLQPRLEESRDAADAAFNASTEALQRYSFPELEEARRKIEQDLDVIRALRPQIDRNLENQKDQRDAALANRWQEDVTQLVHQVQELWVHFIGHFTDIDARATQHVRFKHLLRIITEQTGHERAVIGQLIAENKDPTPEEITQLLRGQGTIELSWQVSHLLATHSGLYPLIERYYTDATSHYFTLRDMTQDIFFLPRTPHEGAYPIDVDLWFELSTQAEESLRELKLAAIRETGIYAAQLMAQMQRTIAFQLGILVVSLVLCFYSFYVITHRVLHPIQRMVDALVKAMRGEPVPLIPPAERHDEIGQLAQVLHAFQQKSEEIRRTSAELERYTHALERSNKELDDFAYIASHDLKEPLRGIHNHSRFLLEDNQDKLDTESVGRLQRLVYLTQRMERLVNDLLYFSRLGRQELAIQSTDLNAVIQDIEATLETFLQERGVKVLLPNPLPVITCDKPRTTELFHNLITNAAKYNDKPEKTIEIGHLDRHAMPDGRIMRRVFYVRDNGIGIAAEFHEEVFRIFKRLQTSKGQEEGTGVGLTFVKKIIERHGGKIWLESKPGQGTIFYFTLEAQT